MQVDEQTSVNSISNGHSDNECSDSSGKRSKASTKRCRKKPRSRPSAAEMLDFLKSYSQKGAQVEELRKA